MAGGVLGIFCALGGLAGLIMGLPRPDNLYLQYTFGSNWNEGAKFGGELYQLSGFDKEAYSELYCRPGYTGIFGDEYSNAITGCQAELKSNAVNNTKECINVCIWHKLDFVNFRTGNVLNKGRLEAVFNNQFKGPGGEKDSKRYIEDFVECFKTSNTSVKYGKSGGCKHNLKFSKCFKKKTDEVCNSTAAANNNSTRSEDNETVAPIRLAMPATTVVPAKPATATPATPAMTPATAKPAMPPAKPTMSPAKPTMATPAMTPATAISAMPPATPAMTPAISAMTPAPAISAMQPAPATATPTMPTAPTTTATTAMPPALETTAMPETPVIGAPQGLIGYG